MVFNFRLIPEKLDSKISQKMQKHHLAAIFGPFLHKIGWIGIFFENRALVVLTSDKLLHSCKKSEITNEPFLKKKKLNRQIDRADLVRPSSFTHV